MLSQQLIIEAHFASGSLSSCDDDKASAGPGSVHGPVLSRW